MNGGRENEARGMCFVRGIDAEGAARVAFCIFSVADFCWDVFPLESIEGGLEVDHGMSEEFVS